MSSIACCSSSSPFHHLERTEVLKSSILLLNPIALRKAKTVCNFGLSECNRVKETIQDTKANSPNSAKLVFCTLRGKQGTLQLIGKLSSHMYQVSIQAATDAKGQQL